jgi:hypothetical protein
VPATAAAPTAATATAPTAPAVTTTVTSTSASATGTATASATITAAVTFRPGGRGRGLDAVEVGLIAFFELGSAFEGQACSAHWRANRDGFHRPSFFTGFTAVTALGRRRATHFRALLFQNGFAREADAIAFYGQHLHQYLVAFF